MLLVEQLKVVAQIANEALQRAIDNASGIAGQTQTVQSGTLAPGQSINPVVGTPVPGAVDTYEELLSIIDVTAPTKATVAGQTVAFLVSGGVISQVGSGGLGLSLNTTPGPPVTAGSLTQIGSSVVQPITNTSGTDTLAWKMIVKQTRTPGTP